MRFFTFSSSTTLVRLFLFATATLFSASLDGVTKNLDLTIATVQEVALTADTTSVTIDSATGDDIDAKTITFVQYAYSTNSYPSSLRVYSSTTLTDGLSVQVRATAPTIGGTSTGWVTLSSTPTALVTAIPASNEGNIDIEVKVDGTIETAPGSYDIIIDFDMV